MQRVAMARRRVEIRGDTPIPDQEAELLIEAISLLAQRQQETEMWAAERIRAAEDRATSAEHRLTSIETQLSALESAVGALVDQTEPALIAGTPEERLSRLREQVEELRVIPSGEEDAESQTVPPPEPVAVAAPPAASAAPPVAQTVAAPPPAPRPQPATVPAPGPAGPSAWQRFEQMPRGQLEKALIVVGVLIVVYAGLWQIAIALGFG